MSAFSKKYYRSLEPLLKVKSLPHPLNWADIFGRTAPLELEIGFGNGEFINRLSLDCPERDFVGIELAWASTKRALRRLARPPRPNVKIILMRAEDALRRLFAPESLDVIRVLFPVPWPNEKHAKKRLFQKDFLDLVANRLKKDGRFILVSDSAVLMEWTLEQAESSALLLHLEEREAEMDTKYERKWERGGHSIFFHVNGVKKFHPALEMPKEFVMQAYYRDEFNPQHYAPEGCVGEIVVKFKDFIFDSEKNQGLLRAFVVEGPLTQDFYIRIRQDGKRWKISPAIVSEIFPTQGVAKALELAALN